MISLNRLNGALRQENYLEHLGTQYFLKYKFGLIYGCILIVQIIC